MSCANSIWIINIINITHSELRERRPWKASEANSDIWLLLKSLWRRMPKEKKHTKPETDWNRTRETGGKRKKAREKRNIEVNTLHKRESVTQCGHFLLYLHPSQLLIWRKSPSWDHLDGVLLQSSGTKHTHRPLRHSINILLSQRYLWRILDWCLFPEGTHSDKALWWPLPKSVTNFCPLSQVHSQMCAQINTP